MRRVLRALFRLTESQAEDMRKLLDELGVRCYSTHNDEDYFSAEKIKHARDLNQILGCKYMVMAYTEPKGGVDGWKVSRQVELCRRPACLVGFEGRLSQS
jgi:hypothetical protein